MKLFKNLSKKFISVYDLKGNFKKRYKRSKLSTPKSMKGILGDIKKTKKPAQTIGITIVNSSKEEKLEITLPDELANHFISGGIIKIEMDKTGEYFIASKKDKEK